MSAVPVSANLQALPAVDRLLRSVPLQPVLAAHGHSSVVATLRALLDEVRARAVQTPLPTDDELCATCAARLEARARPQQIGRAHV